MSHQAAPLNPFLDAYCMPRQYLLDWRPQGPGLYALCADNRIYIAETENLAGRLISSSREQDFGDTIVCFPLSSPRFLSMKAQRAGLEADCISALHTLLWGNRTPLNLTNKRYVEKLHAIAWRAQCPPDLVLAITVARTILSAMGMPRAWFGLPYCGMLYAGSPQSSGPQVELNWPTIRNTARRLCEERFQQSVKAKGTPLYSLKTTFCQLRREDAKARLASAAGERPSGHFGAGLIF